MNQISSPSPATRYVISYTIRDGDNEYKEIIRQQFDHNPSEEELVLAVAGNYCWDLTGDVKKEVLDEWNHEYVTGHKNGFFTIPGDYRMVDDIECEKEAQHRVLIIVSGGVAEYAADDNVAICLIDFDNEPNKEVPACFTDLMPQLRSAS